MKGLQQLINQLCPNGVEWKTLGKLCEINKGEQLNKENMSEVGSYPVINGGICPSGYVEVYNQPKDTITISQGGASAGYVNWMKTEFWAGAHCYVVIPNKEIVSNRYVYHYVKSIESKLQECQYGAGIPALAKKTVEQVQIPLPPLAIQSRIVEILDHFTNLTANLTAELALRRKQFEHFREKLLSLDGVEGVEWKALKEVFTTRNGYTPSTSNQDFWENGTIPWFKMEDIREKGRILSDSANHITPAAIKGKGLFKANSIILATSATIGEHALITVDHLSNQRFTNFYPKEDYASILDMKFVYYYFFIIDNWCKEHTVQGNFAGVNMTELYNCQIPVPPLAVQQSIVAKLDKFTALIQNIENELALRQKQYEYYREKLLSFPSPSL